MAPVIVIVLSLLIYGNGETAWAEDSPAPGTSKSEKKVDLVVGMKNWVFSPEDLVVSLGETVIFKNDDDSYHKIHFEDPTMTPSEMIKPGKEFRVTFSKAGTFPYYCKTHRDYKMQGKIVVRSQNDGGR